MRPTLEDTLNAAREAMARGYLPVSIRDKSKAPYGGSWQHTSWRSEEEMVASFTARYETAPGIGLVLGDKSDRLVDVDIDHHSAWRLREHFLPPTPMQTGRLHSPRSHRWYRISEDSPMPSTRQYKMPDGQVSVELRSNGGQTVIPPSVWWDKPKPGQTLLSPEPYEWYGQPWGGSRGPTEIDGRKLAIQVALLGLGAILVDSWPRSGSRHAAYLALAGGLLRAGDHVHEFWEQNLPVLILALADATGDEDGGDTRVSEVMRTTLDKIRNGEKAQGFPTLAEIIGVDAAEAARRRAGDVEALSGWRDQSMQRVDPQYSGEPTLPMEEDDEDDTLVSALPPENRNPLEERVTTWAEVDLEPYLSGEIVMPEPGVLRREDGVGLFYPGVVNALFGASESAKSFIALQTCVQEMGRGDRAVYVDLEDHPAGTIERLRLLGMGDDDIKNQFRYVHPEGPLADMQRGKFGDRPTADGSRSHEVFNELLTRFDPTLIVVDGMTVLYGLHGLDTNEAMSTDVITTWLKKLTRGGRSTVVIIDHTGKGGGPGASPIGAHHKTAMVQGTSLRVETLTRPMRGALGSVRLVVFKDRPGNVRPHCTAAAEQIASVVSIDSRVEGETRMTFAVPDGNDFTIGGMHPDSDKRLAELAKAEEQADSVLVLFGGDLDKTLTTNEVADLLGIPTRQVYPIWQMLVGRGVLVKEGVSKSARWRLRDPDVVNPVRD